MNEATGWVRLSTRVLYVLRGRGKANPSRWFKIAVAVAEQWIPINEGEGCVWPTVRALG